MITADISKLFTEISHHYKSSIFFIGQNLFYDNKDFRNLALNTHYLFLMKVSGNIQIISIKGSFHLPLYFFSKKNLESIKYSTNTNPLFTLVWLQEILDSRSISKCYKATIYILVD